MLNKTSEFALLEKKTKRQHYILMKMIGICIMFRLHFAAAG